MKPLWSFAVLMLACGAAAAQDGQQHINYQNQLLQRPMTPAIKLICDQKVGPQNPQNQAAYSACRVTRWFLADISANKDQGFPPLADIQWTKTGPDGDPERNAIMDRLTKYGG